LFDWSVFCDIRFLQPTAVGLPLGLSGQQSRRFWLISGKSFLPELLFAEGTDRTNEEREGGHRGPNRVAKPPDRPRMPVFGNHAGNRSTAANAGVTGGTGGGTPPPPDRAERTRHERAGVKANASEASEACRLA